MPPSIQRLAARSAAVLLVGAALSPSATARQVNNDRPGPRDARALEAKPASFTSDFPKPIDVGQLQLDLNRARAQFGTSYGSFAIPTSGITLIVWFAMLLAAGRRLTRTSAVTNQPEAGGDVRRADRRSSVASLPVSHSSARRPSGRRFGPEHPNDHRSGQNAGGAIFYAQAGGEGRVVPTHGCGARIPLPDSWEGGQCATFRGGAKGLWLQFNQDAQLAYTTNRYLLNEQSSEHAFYISLTPILLQFRAGQQVRVVDHRLQDDGLGYEPTVRADFAEVCVSPPDAAVEVQVLPG